MSTFLTSVTDPETVLLTFHRSANSEEDLDEFKTVMLRITHPDAAVPQPPLKKVFVIDLRKTSISLAQMSLSRKIISFLDSQNNVLRSLFKSILCVVPSKAYSVLAKSVLYFSQFHRHWHVVFSAPQDCRTELAYLKSQK